MATVQRGEGITHTLVRQLEADPEKFGFRGDQKELHGWATKLSKDIAISQGYIKPNGDEIRIKFGKDQIPAFVLRSDGSVEEVGVTARAVNDETMPRVNVLIDDLARETRALGRVVNTLGEQPQSIVFGTPPGTPGPGEPGFTGGK